MSTVLSAVTTTGASTGITSGGAAACFAHVFSASTSSCTVKVQQSLDNATWYTVATITDPTSEGELWVGPAAPYTRVNVSARASGTLSANLAFNKSDGNALSAGWHRIEAEAVTYGALTATSVTDSGLTSGRVVYAGSGGLLA